MELGFLVINGVVCQDYLPRTETHQVTQFAGCGCQDACNCVVSSGDTTTVTGSGSAVDPYIVEVAPNTASITVEDTECIDLNGSGTPADPVNATIIISPDLDNLLARAGSGCTANGLKIACTDVMGCIVTGDCLEVVGGEINVKIAPDVDGGNGVECSPDGLLVAPSADGGNTMVYGSDGRLYTPSGPCVATPMTVMIDVAGGAPCLSATGGGCAGDPYTITLGLAADPNALDCTATGLQVIPSTDAGNSMIFGTDGRLFTPTPFVQVLDTATVDLTLTGTGTSGDPFILSACTAVPVGVPGSCINVNVTKTGPTCAEPYAITATPVISPDPCNGLECRPNGLFAENFEGLTSNARIDVCTPFLPNPNPVPLPTTGRVTIIPMQEITITNTSTCKDMIVTLYVDFPQTIVSSSGGIARVIGMVGEDGGPLADAVSQTVDGTPFLGRFVNMHLGRVQTIPIPPGGSATYSAQLDIQTNGIDPGGLGEGCIAISALGVLT